MALCSCHPSAAAVSLFLVLYSSRDVPKFFVRAFKASPFCGCGVAGVDVGARGLFGPMRKSASQRVIVQLLHSISKLCLRITSFLNFLPYYNIQYLRNNELLEYLRGFPQSSRVKTANR
jgi:hypothetical protein